MPRTLPQSPDDTAKIVFTFADHAHKQFVKLAAHSFKTKAELAGHWALIPAFDGDTAFCADRYNERGELCETRMVDAEVIEQFTNRSIGHLIANGREALSRDIVSTPTRKRLAA